MCGRGGPPSVSAPLTLTHPLRPSPAPPIFFFLVLFSSVRSPPCCRSAPQAGHTGSTKVYFSPPSVSLPTARPPPPPPPAGSRQPLPPPTHPGARGSATCRGLWAARRGQATAGPARPRRPPPPGAAQGRGGRARHRGGAGKTSPGRAPTPRPWRPEQGRAWPPPAQAMVRTYDSWPTNRGGAPCAAHGQGAPWGSRGGRPAAVTARSGDACASAREIATTPPIPGEGSPPPPFSSSRGPTPPS